MKAELLGSDITLDVTDKDGKVMLLIPHVNPDSLKTEFLYTYKLSKK